MADENVLNFHSQGGGNWAVNGCQTVAGCLTVSGCETVSGCLAVTGCQTVAGCVTVQSGGVLTVQSGGTANLTDATVTLGAGQVTVPKISFAGMFLYTGNGATAAGNAAVNGTLAGQRLLFAFPIAGNATAGGNNPTSLFNGTINANNVANQTDNGNWSLTRFAFVVANATA